MKKSITIQIPEGYDDVVFNKETNKLEFIKKNFIPKSWEEYCNNHPFTGNEYYITHDGIYKSGYKSNDARRITNKGYTESEQEAEAFLALMQLRQLRKAWVGDWEPNWKVRDCKYVIQVLENNLSISTYANINYPLNFPTEKMAIDFLNCFKGLIEKAKILL